MSYFVALVIALGFGLPVAVLAAATAQGRAASSALEGMARQPEAAGPIQMAMIIALALIEAMVLYALVMFFLLRGYLPSTDKLLAIIGK